MNDLCNRLQELIHQEVPLTKVMGMRAVECLDDSLTLQAPLEPNINIHGTAFGGAQFSMAALAGWGLLQIKLSDGGEPENMVLGHAQIAYHHTVRGDIRVRCRLPAADKLQSFMNDFHKARKARIRIVSEILTEKGVAATFTGVYIAWKKTQTD